MILKRINYQLQAFCPSLSLFSLMQIQLLNAGKRFGQDWIFRKMHYTFLPATRTAITGPNGCGKSTLLQILAGNVSLSEGVCEWENFEKALDPGLAFAQIAFTAPYLELVEEMTAFELLKFHAVFKPLNHTLSIEEMLSFVSLPLDTNKQIRNFSSGMKQRLKLAQCFFSDVPVLLLDEPCSNLDKEGYEMYYNLIANYGNDRLIIVASNDEKEYAFCDRRVSMPDYK